MGKKIALVTGANRGIGFETCRQLSQLGLTVLLTSRDTKKGEAATKQLTDKGLDVVYCQLDVSNTASGVCLAELCNNLGTLMFW